MRLGRLTLVASIVGLTLTALAGLWAIDLASDGVLSSFARSALNWALPFYLLLVFLWAYRLASWISSRENVTPSPLDQVGRWIDDPQDLDSIDSFERRGFVDQFEKAIDEIATSSSSSVIGLSGRWGAGKSSVLLTLRNRIEARDSEPKWIVANLNPWRYINSDALVVGFFAELRGALPKNGRWSEASSALANVLDAAAPIGSLSSIAGWDSSGLLSSLARRFRSAGQASKTQDLAETALRALGRPVLVIVDDIDRLGPDELLALFKLIRLLGRLPNVHYLLAYDDHTVSDVLTRTGLVGKSRSRAREYLEKIVQIRLDLPPIREAQAQAASNDLLTRIMQRFGYSPSSTRTAEFALTYQAHMTRSLRTPRAIGRWGGHLRLLYPALVGEVDFYDFAAFTWLRLTYPGVADTLHLNKSLIFPSTNLASYVQGQNLHVIGERWRSLLHAASPPAEHDSVIAVVSFLFPSIEAALQSREASSLEAVARRMGIGHPDYFERYFFLGVPSEEVSESDLDDGLRKVAENPLDTSSSLARYLQTEASSLTSRIEVWAEAHRTLLRPLVVWLTANAEVADDSDLFSARAAIQGTLYRILRRELALLADMISDESHPGPKIPLIRTADQLLRDGTRSPAENQRLRQAALGFVEQRLNQQSSALEFWSRDQWQLFWAWRRIDSSSLKSWYQSLVRDSNDLLQALAGLVPSGRAIGVPDAVSRLRSISAPDVDAVLGVDWVRERLSELGPIVGERKSADDWDGPEDTWDTRRAVARDFLARIDQL